MWLWLLGSWRFPLQHVPGGTELLQLCSPAHLGVLPPAAAVAAAGDLLPYLAAGEQQSLADASDLLPLLQPDFASDEQQLLPDLAPALQLGLAAPQQPSDLAAAADAAPEVEAGEQQLLVIWTFLLQQGVAAEEQQLLPVLALAPHPDLAPMEAVPVLAAQQPPDSEPQPDLAAADAAPAQQPEFYYLQRSGG